MFDTQFTRADALRVAALVLDSGKKLTTIYISQGDPDYYFGLEVLKQEFPDVKVYVSADTVKHKRPTQTDNSRSGSSWFSLRRYLYRL